jgi:membrane protein insertase Oxa1/YidC/SpoIIIJ
MDLSPSTAGLRKINLSLLMFANLSLLMFATAIMTAAMMSVSPDMPEQLRILMIVLPTVIAVVAALQFSSALAIYWATSNTFSALQTLALPAVVRRRVRSGAINI